MENLNIQEIWNQHGILLEKTRKLNESLLREVKLGQAKSSLKSLLFLPISTLLFYLIAASYGLYFTVVNWETWYFAFSGAVVTFFSLLFIASSIRQLKQILSIDYQAPVLKLQKDTSRIKVSVVYNLKIAAWILPFAPFIGLFLVKALFNFDLIQIINDGMIVSFAVVTIILEILSLFVLRALRPENISQKWLNWMLQGSGSQVDEALGFLTEIEEFEKEER
ncbi:hypothetical protein [Gaoshiqia sediminis]|uniref:Uncharacterized protein n=1 Tax=Gaoshiqia sediminis TaxID=2986998 RepID=A0AA42C6Z6_9BACT|nr:hypothetical protein [Gaoshiqia sediminis]MCW0483064.1 hypothetical protein [Gaoshiqia sediminis]